MIRPEFKWSVNRFITFLEHFFPAGIAPVSQKARRGPKGGPLGPAPANDRPMIMIRSCPERSILGEIIATPRRKGLIVQDRLLIRGIGSKPAIDKGAQVFVQRVELRQGLMLPARLGHGTGQ